MVLSEHAEAGHAGRLDSLSAAIDLKACGVDGEGTFRIDEGGDPPRLVWNLSRHSGFNLSSQDDDTFDETVRSLEKFQSETIALRGSNDPTINTASSQHSSDKRDVGPENEVQHAWAGYDSYLKRMEMLHDEARHDGYVLNIASEIDFRLFIESAPRMRRGNLVLMDNGNLRAIWKGEHGTHLGLQFLGGRMVQYVIFKRRKQGQRISRVSGRDTLEGIERQIGAFELSTLLYR